MMLKREDSWNPYAQSLGANSPLFDTEGIRIHRWDLVRVGVDTCMPRETAAILPDSNGV